MTTLTCQPYLSVPAPSSMNSLVSSYQSPVLALRRKTYAAPFCTPRAKGPPGLTVPFTTWPFDEIVEYAEVPQIFGSSSKAAKDRH